MVSQHLLINSLQLLVNHFQLHSHLKEDKLQFTMRKMELQHPMKDMDEFTKQQGFGQARYIELIKHFLHIHFCTLSQQFLINHFQLHSHLKKMSLNAQRRK
jgi:hypothetical protein